jgi:hypothetical protein
MSKSPSSKISQGKQEIVGIDDIADKFEELQNYSDSQFKTIIDLQKKLTKLEEENSNLKLLVNSAPLPAITGGSSGAFDGISNEQVICETQIAILKEAAMNRALTLEECRKLDIYVNILKDVRTQQKENKVSVASNMSEEDLMSFIAGGEE